ncbi:UbiH/UbiF/VisC/COQ6 family ubiquinone biosynthesis hydroxylase [Glacieibacterium frigidum]|uniref:Ubiquinone biosynthesis protein UbiH n=1 Tax=Glacieibacterium frigidum TaxID=2593303 RepID=A0A552UFG8_9SPHN|nr:UbiH/UbiF/VisC/COQ6 family ubiquinone biosynthesis hydroxylase [Glacieibacterium frigidum]TRW16962.1 ubiquinone biosynthesis protein UbiH [Glacieibacterium frigidum]
MQHDVIIIGGGLVGMTLALALDAHGVTSAVVDAADLGATTTSEFDGRVSAIASASARMFRAIGLGGVLDKHGGAIDGIRVTDGLSPLNLHFDAAEGDAGPLGWMVENRLLRTALLEAQAKAAGLTLHAPARAVVERTKAGVTATLGDGTVLGAPLVVAADGRRSALREAAGIRASRWTYPNVALVTMIEHADEHGGVAAEIFYPSGPFAVLPMRDPHRSAIVWTVDEGDAPGYLKLGPRGLSAEIARATGGYLGDLQVIAPPSSYPLSFHHAGSYVAERLALIGDAAHGIHPIAGQGLNMGLRDVAALTEVLVDAVRTGLDLGAPAVLDRYDRWRRVDNMAVAAATDTLNQLFALKGRAPAAVRRLGLAAVERIAPLKRRFMAEARGETGDRPKLLLGELV